MTAQVHIHPDMLLELARLIIATTSGDGWPGVLTKPTAFAVVKSCLGSVHGMELLADPMLGPWVTKHKAAIFKWQEVQASNHRTTIL